MKADPRTKAIFSAAMSLLAVVICGCFLFQPAEKVSWPTYGWKTRSPEKVGMDSALIEAMMEDIDQSGLSLDGLVVIHKGAIVAERYFHIFRKSTLHETYSVTKSVISALVGIALQQGCIGSVDDQVLAYLPEMEVDDPDGHKGSLTIRDFLTMSSGLAFDPDEMYASTDWALYTLNQPLISQPGESWFYSNGGPQVLSAVISQACEMDTVEFAESYLFNPLGIRKYQWQRGMNGNPNGSWGLELTPRDMAKFGYLYINQGVWEGKQILPPDWVSLSSTGFHPVPDSLEPWDLYYGFLWWVHADGYYAAHGYKGQFIYLAPEQDLVIVITGNLSDQEFVEAQLLIREYLVPAVGNISSGD